MTETSNRLYELLPAIHRRLDVDRGHPLRALLQVIEHQADLLEADIAQSYENLFIETAEDWVVPYLGDLVGYSPIHSGGEMGDPATERGAALNRVLIPRRDVANTIANRRRKGTLALLEEVAEDVSGWPARAVEFFRLLVESVNPDFLHLDRGRSADLRDREALDRLGTPFDRMAHTIDVRQPSSPQPSGRFNLPTVGVFVWRLRTHPVTSTSAYCLEEAGSHNFTFSILGNDAPLYGRAEPDVDGSIAEPHHLPVPITRRELERDLERDDPHWYGPGRSVEITVGSEHVPVTADRIVAADLSGWSYLARRGTVAVDPELGRISFPPSETPDDGVWVSYRYGFPDDLGGGEYTRSVGQPTGAVVIAVGGPDDGPELPATTIAEALERWRERRPLHTVIEIRESGYYIDPIAVDLETDQTLQIRAASGVRPVIRLLDRQPGRADSLRIRGEKGSRFSLDGLTVVGRPIRAEGHLRSLEIRHSTLVPGWDLAPNCDPRRPAEPSIELDDTCACLVVDHSIVGSIQVDRNAAEREPNRIEIVDSVVDATAEHREAIGGVGWPLAHAVLTMARSTVIGEVQVHAVEVVENSILLGHVCVGRRQVGCIRFSYVPDGSRTPRRHRCQPDLVSSAITGHDETTERRRERERRRVRPQFESVRYGTPTYVRLCVDTAEEILVGADDRSEMGVFHDLFDPQRRTNLEVRLAEYVPASTDVGVFYAT